MIIIQPNMMCEVALESTRDVLGRVFGGVTLSCHSTVAGAQLIVDDDGFHKRLPFNILASGLYGGPVVGPVVLMTLAETYLDRDDEDAAVAARAVPCPACHGTGVNTDDVRPIVCAACLATGVNPDMLAMREVPDVGKRPGRRDTVG